MQAFKNYTFCLKAQIIPLTANTAICFPWSESHTWFLFEKTSAKHSSESVVCLWKTKAASSVSTYWLHKGFSSRWSLFFRTQKGFVGNAHFEVHNIGKMCIQSLRLIKLIFYTACQGHSQIVLLFVCLVGLFLLWVCIGKSTMAQGQFYVIALIHVRNKNFHPPLVGTVSASVNIVKKTNNVLELLWKRFWPHEPLKYLRDPIIFSLWELLS